LRDGVAVGAAVDGGVSGGLDRLGHVEVGQADAQVDGVFQATSQLEDLADARGFDVPHAGGDPVVVHARLPRSAGVIFSSGHCIHGAGPACVVLSSVAGTASSSCGRTTMSATLQRYTGAAGRLLLCVIFVLSGLHKITDWADTEAYMTSHGMPA